MRAACYTARELAQRAPGELPAELQSAKHLIYSSPAALDFNSPGAEGFGVKRAGLAVPGSVMLLVAPGCCGRNTSLLSRMPQYDRRFFYLLMDETDVVTGRHLKKIPDAVCEIADSLPRRPSAVMICITCVDALLGTDMERVCRRAEAAAGLPVRPCYMYALTREGRRPPMVQVRQSLYSLLEPRPKDPAAVNLLGFFSPLADDCELYALLRSIGVRRVRELSRCQTFAEYLAMAEANFNLVLNPEARLAAQDFETRLGIPSIELRRLHRLDKIHSQYQALGAALGVTPDDGAMLAEARAETERFREKYGGLTFSLGECMDADPFELAAALLRAGFGVREIFGTVTGESRVYLRQIAALSPETKIYSNLEPTMFYYDCASGGADVTVGKDAGYYHTGVPNLRLNGETKPFGYAGVRRLCRALDALLAGGEGGA